MSIRRKLILSIVLPLLVLYAAVLGWDYSRSRQQAIEQAQQLVAERAGNTAAQLNERLLAVQQNIDAAAGVLTNRQTVSEFQVRSVLLSMMRPNVWTDSAWIAFAPEASRPLRVSAVPAVTRSRLVFTDPAVGLGGPPSAQPGGNPGGGLRGPGGLLPEMELTLSKPAIEQSWYTAVHTAHRGMWFDPVDFDEPDGGQTVVYSAPFYNAAGEFVGVVCASVRVDDLQYLRNDPSSFRPQRRGNEPAPTTAPALPLGQGGFVLLDRKRELLSHPDSLVFSQARERRDETRFPELSEAIATASGGRGSVINVSGLDEVVSGFVRGEAYMLALEPIRSTGWVYLTAVPESQLMGPVQQRLIQRGGVLVVSVFVLAAFVTLLITRFCRPIEKMAGRVKQIARGEIDIDPIPVRSNDEIGQLARGFNAMTSQLRDHIQQLTEQSAAREKVVSELRIARQIQTDLLPRTFPPFPERTEFDLHAINIPARLIAGDYFDFFFSSPEVLTVVIADVSGKGVPAAMMMAVTRTIIRNLALAGLTPAEIVDRANRALVEDTSPSLFVTMILGQYRPRTGEFTFVNAGHPYAVRFGPSTTPDRACPPTAPLMGVSITGELGPTEQQTITLEVGEGLLFYTDGVTEARGEGDAMFGEAELLEHVAKLAGVTSPQLCETVARDVMTYQDNAASDDVTLLAIRRLR